MTVTLCPTVASTKMEEYGNTLFHKIPYYNFFFWSPGTDNFFAIPLFGKRLTFWGGGQSNNGTVRSYKIHAQNGKGLRKSGTGGNIYYWDLY